MGHCARGARWSDNPDSISFTVPVDKEEEDDELETPLVLEGGIANTTRGSSPHGEETAPSRRAAPEVDMQELSSDGSRSGDSPPP